MQGLISGNYERLEGEQIERVARECADAWKDPAIPARQFHMAAKSELANFLRGERTGPFGVLYKLVESISSNRGFRVLDIGASAGYHKEIIAAVPSIGYGWEYTALDYSEAFRDFARTLYPGIRYDVADATALPYHDSAFDVVISGACIMHIREYRKAIEEAVRVSKRYVILHRTPILVASGANTSFFQKSAYGVPCLEIHFSGEEITALLASLGLKVLQLRDVFYSNGFGHYSYLLEKQPSELMHHPV